MFCKNFNCMPFPLNEEVLCLFVTNLAESVSFKTLKLYLSAVKFQNMELGFRDSMSKMTQLQLTLCGIKRTLGAHGSRKPCLPISIVTMRLLKRYIFMSKLTNHNKLMFWSACTLAFFGFLRSSEYVSTSASRYSKQKTLLHRDVPIKKGRIHLTIKASKTDPFREGVTLIIAPTHHSICPVRALKRYLAKSPFHSGPLYKHKNGKCLTRQEVSRLIKKAVRKNGINPKQYSSHSFRIGAASTAAAAGISDSIIKSLGRWRSECYQRYIRINKQKLYEVPKKLVRIQDISETWSPLV